MSGRPGGRVSIESPKQMIKWGRRACTGRALVGNALLEPTKEEMRPLKLASAAAQLHRPASGRAFNSQLSSGRRLSVFSLALAETRRLVGFKPPPLSLSLSRCWLVFDLEKASLAAESAYVPFESDPQSSGRRFVDCWRPMFLSVLLRVAHSQLTSRQPHLRHPSPTLAQPADCYSNRMAPVSPALGRRARQLVGRQPLTHWPVATFLFLARAAVAS